MFDSIRNKTFTETYLTESLQHFINSCSIHKKYNDGGKFELWVNIFAASYGCTHLIFDEHLDENSPTASDLEIKRFP